MRLVTIILLLAMHPAWSQTLTGDSWKQVNSSKRGTITLAYVQTPSFVYEDNSGKLTGICIDIMTDFKVWLKTTKGVDINTKLTGDGNNFKGMYNQVKNAQDGVFGLGNITITEDRKKEVKFSDPFITNFAILITHSNVPTLTKLEDLPKTFNSLTAYTAKGTLNEGRTKELKSKYYPDMKINYTTTSQETFEKIVNDPAGYAYLDLAFYLEAVRLKQQVKRHPIADKAAEQFGFILPLNSDWKPVLDEFLKANGGYFTSTSYKNILLKHLGETGMKLVQSAKK